MSGTESAPADVAAGGSAAKPVQSLPDRALDQWRGLALVLVLISHAFFLTGRVPGIGRAGVNLFFFISGILVFRSLARGPLEALAGARYFWTRRFRRLAPAIYFYLFCMTILVLLAGPWLTPDDFQHTFFRSLPSSLLWYRNYYFAASGPIKQNLLTGHLWSVSCEMQFYLLAPLIYFAGGKSPGRRALLWGGTLGLMMAGGLSALEKANQWYNPYTFQVAAWPVMVGFCAEYLRERFPRYASALAPFLVWAGVLSLVTLWPAMWLGRKHLVVLTGTLLVGGCAGCYVNGRAPRGWVGDALHFLGNRTYSIYLWQEPLTIGGLLPAAWHPLGSLLAVPVGALSFRFLERPFMSKYKARRPPASKTQDA